jgi:hypothetical protein
MKLEKSIFKVDVLEVSIRVDEPTRNSFRNSAQESNSFDQLASRVEHAAYDAKSAQVTVLFLRSIDFQRFTKEIRSNARCALRERAIDAAEFHRVDSHLESWFSALKARGVKKGDQLVYQILPQGLHTSYRTVEGQELVNQTDPGDPPKRSVLGGFLASCSEFRNGLVRSLQSGATEQSRLRASRRAPSAQAELRIAIRALREQVPPGRL